MNTGSLSEGLEKDKERSLEETELSRRYVCFGTFQVDLEHLQVFQNGMRVKIEPKVFETLVAFLDKPGELVTREALCTRLWPGELRVNHDANVNTTVNKLRQVLGDSPTQPKFVETIPRRGYNFIATVQFADKLGGSATESPASEISKKPPLNAWLAQTHIPQSGLRRELWRWW